MGNASGDAVIGVDAWIRWWMTGRGWLVTRAGGAWYASRNGGGFVSEDLMMLCMHCQSGVVDA